MTMKEFTQFAKEAVLMHLPEEMRSDITIEATEVSKMNDQTLHGIIFKPNDSEAAPTLYVDDLYERHIQGEGPESLVKELAERYEEARFAPAPPQIDFDWKAMKGDLSVRLLEKSRNKGFISNMPYFEVGNGFVLTADINMSAGRDGSWRIAVNQDVLGQLGVDRDTLLKTALENAASSNHAVMTEMSQALFGLGGENLFDRDGALAPEEISGMYVLTTEEGNLGACALFYPGVKEKAAEMLGSGYYVLPSSIHEVILVPDTAGHKENELCDMVKKANRTVVEPQDVLSDNVYHYDKDTHVLKTLPAEEPETVDAFLSRLDACDKEMFEAQKALVAM